MQGVEPWRRPEGAFKTYRDAVGNYEPSGRKKRQEQLYCTTATSYKPAWRSFCIKYICTSSWLIQTASAYLCWEPS